MGLMAIEHHFYYWAFPILCVESLLLGLAGYAFYHQYYKTCQILLAVVGLYWAFASLWQETLIGIWYPDFDYLMPPNMKADNRPHRYLAFCDIASWAMCSPALMSPYNRLLSMIGVASEDGWLDFANGSLGVVMYVCHFFCPIFKAAGF